MNDLEYLHLFRNAPMRPMVLQYFLERKYGVETLIKYAASQEAYPLPDYASWVLTHLVKEFPHQMIDHQPGLIDTFLVSNNQSVLRNVSAAFVLQPLIAFKESELYDDLLQHLACPDDKVALQVNCIYKLIQFAKKYPEFIPEITAVIELRTTQNRQASLKAAANKFTKVCQKIKQRP